jgi:hypothetical protein
MAGPYILSTGASELLRILLGGGLVMGVSLQRQHYLSTDAGDCQREESFFLLFDSSRYVLYLESIYTLTQTLTQKYLEGHSAIPHT